jgi:hypothetical protein
MAPKLATLGVAFPEVFTVELLEHAPSASKMIAAAAARTTECDASCGREPVVPLSTDMAGSSG